MDRGRGPVATVLVQNGTLHTGDVFICGAVYGKVRALFDDHGRTVKEAGPSTPVEVLGLQGVPVIMFHEGADATAMHAFYDAPFEAATACGALLLVVTFLSIIPAGLIFARVSG